MKIHSSKELKRYNYLSSEIDAAYHELSSKMGLPDSSMIVLYTICDNGDSCPLRDIVPSFTTPASANRPSIPPCASWKRKESSI